MEWRNKSETTGGVFSTRMEDDYTKKGELKEQTWSEVADSAKGTLVTEVEADETVEVVAPCIMGTFIQASQTKDKGRGCGRGEEGGGGGEGGQEWYGYHGKMCRVTGYGTNPVILPEWSAQTHAKTKEIKKITYFISQMVKRKCTVLPTHD